MKPRTCIVAAALVSVLAASARAQGTFQNLDFQSAAIVPVPGDPYGRVDFASAFPGWTGYVGTNLQTRALYDSVFLDSTGIGIHSTNSSLTPIEGNYSAYLQARYELFNYPNLIEASLAQVGLVPADSKSLQFKARGANFQVSLNGQPLTLTSLFVTNGYTLYGADISTLAGITGELRFTAFPLEPPFQGALYLDSIEFSTQVIPEPSAIGLFALGGFLLGWRLRRQQSV